MMGLRVGSAQVDITPALGIPLSGYGPVDARGSRGVAGRLFATVITVMVGEQRLAIVALDLHASPLHLTVRVDEVVRSALGRRFDLWMGASHTHSGPGHFYGSGFYDWGAAPQRKPWGKGRDKTMVAWLSERIGAAIVAAFGGVKAPSVLRCVPPTEGTLHFGSPLVPDISWQRSFESFAANFVDLEHVRKGRPDRGAERDVKRRVLQVARGSARKDPRWLAAFAATMAGRSEREIPGVLSERRLAVVPCIDVLSVRQSSALIGAVGVLHATPTLMGKRRLYSADVAGEAARLARLQLGSTAPMGFMGGAHGDVNVVVPGVFVDETRRALHDRDLDKHPMADQTRRLEARRKLLAHRDTAARRLADGMVEGCAAPELAGFSYAFTRRYVSVYDPANYEAAWTQDPASREERIARPGTGPSRATKRVIARSPRPVVGLGFTVGSNLARIPTAGDRVDDSDVDSLPPINALLSTVVGGRKVTEGIRSEAEVDAELPAPTTASRIQRYRRKHPSCVDDDEARTNLANIPKTKTVQVQPDRLPSDLLFQGLRLMSEKRKVALMLSVPGEPSTGLAWRVQQVLRQRHLAGAEERVALCAPAGGYCGYFCTPREYLRQQYEGAAQWWGRDHGVWVENRLQDIANDLAGEVDNPKPLPGDLSWAWKSRASSGPVWGRVPGWERAVPAAGEGEVRALERWLGVEQRLIELVGWLPVELPDPLKAKPLADAPLFKVEVRTEGGVVEPLLLANGEDGDERTLGSWVEVEIVGGKARLAFLTSFAADVSWSRGRVAFRVVGSDGATGWRAL